MRHPVKRITHPLAFFLMVTGSAMWPLSSAATYADVPHLIRYQGQAVDAKGVPLEGPHDLTFRLYDAATGGTAVWTEPHPAVLLAKGYFTVLLGSVTTFPGSLDWSTPLWLAVQVNGEPELSPRQQITSVPRAIRADVAEKLSVPVATSNITDDTNRLVPSGAVILWMSAACPAGYTRVSSLDDKFLVSGASFNSAAGGSNTHSHERGSYAGPSHTHTVPASQAVWGMTASNSSDNGKMNTLGGYGRATVDAATSASGTGPISGTSASADSRPEFATIVLCQKD